MVSCLAQIAKCPLQSIDPVSSQGAGSVREHQDSGIGRCMTTGEKPIIDEGCFVTRSLDFSTGSLPRNGEALGRAANHT